jgi:hypothetical protein
MQPQIDLKNKITEQEKRISELERQLYHEKTALGVARGQILQQSRVADGLKIELQQMVTAKDKAEATIGIERVLRVGAERKLKAYVDAQKKMAAQFT